MPYSLSDNSLSGFPSIDKAIAYIKSKVADLYKQPLILEKQRERLNKLKEVAQKKGDDVAYGKLVALESSLEDSMTRQATLEKTVGKITKAMPLDGLGIIPLLVAGVAIPTAALLYLHYKKISAQEKALDAIQAGLLTPEEAANIMGPQPLFGGFGGLSTGVLIGVVVVVGGLFFLTRK